MPGPPRKLAVAAGFATLAVLAGVGLFAQAAVPVPDPVVTVRTTSGGVVKETPLLPLGLPAAIDVDNRDGADVAVSVGLIDLSRFPRLIVPNVRIARAPGAAGRTPPPVKVEVILRVRDLADGLRELASVSYGYQTPVGGAIPPVVTARLTGPLTGGFVDPLIAEIDAPGYRAPLDVLLGLRTQKIEGDFSLAYDPLPERTVVTEDPRPGGHHLTIASSTSGDDIDLDADAELRRPADDVKQRIDARIERLPQTIDIDAAVAAAKTTVTATTVAAGAKPDVEASVAQRTLESGELELDARLRLAGVPPSLSATIGADAAEKVDLFDLEVLGGGEIDAVDIAARTFEGDRPARLPALPPLPEQGVAVAAVPKADGEAAAPLEARGRLERVRRLRFARGAAATAPGGIDLVADTGDGSGQLRAFADIDDRGTERADGSVPRRLRADARVEPMPRRFSTVLRPQAGSEPMQLTYSADRPTTAATDLTIAKGERSQCGAPEVLCAQATVTGIPAGLEIGVPGGGAPDLFARQTGTPAEGGTDVRLALDQTPKEPEPRNVVGLRIDDLPERLTGRLRSEQIEIDGEPETLLREAEFHACEFAFAEQRCDGEEGEIGLVALTARNQPDRAGLPARPAVGDQHVTLLRRREHSEVEARVESIRHLALHQRPAANDPARVTFGVRVAAGAGAAFDAAIDDVGDARDGDGRVIGEARRDVRVGVDALPTDFSACLRPTAEVPVEQGDGDPLLADCDAETALGRPVSELPATPLTLAYRADGEPTVTARVRQTAPDPERANEPVTQELRTTVDRVPARLRADVLPGLPADPARGRERARPLELEYGAGGGEPPDVKVDLRTRVGSARCRDPRPGRESLCFAGTLRDVPGSLRATVAQERDDLLADVRIGEGERVRPSLKDLSLAATPPLPPPEEQRPDPRPTVLTGEIVGLPQRLLASVRSRPPLRAAGAPTADPAQPTVQEVALDACPGSAEDEECEGIGRVDLGVTNLVGSDPLPTAPDTGGPRVAVVQRGDDLRAELRIDGLHDALFSTLDARSQASRTTRLATSFDGSQPIRAFVDRAGAGAGERMLLDGEIAQAPSGVGLCLRPALPTGEQPQTDDIAAGAEFCAAAPAGRTAVEARLDRAGKQRPDIDIDRLELRGGRTISGSLEVNDVGERLQLLSGGGELSVAGADGATAAGRLSFDLADRPAGPRPNRFPYRPLDGAADPLTDTRNRDPREQTRFNAVVVALDGGGFSAAGSIPDIRRLRLAPDRCDASDPRFPAPDAITPEESRPRYSCVELDAAQGRPLGLALRALAENGAGTADDGVLALEDGHVSAMPDELRATLATASAEAALDPVCPAGEPGSAPALPCRPPLLSVVAPPAADPDPLIEGRLAIGSRGELSLLRNAEPEDTLSRRLDYERAPRHYAQDGVRVKLATGAAGSALRAGLRVRLPRHLDLDPPTLFSCSRPSLDEGCEGAGVGSAHNHGTESRDVLLRLAAAEARPYAADVPTLGRVAAFVRDREADAETILTGAPDATHDTFGRPFGPENPPLPGNLEPRPGDPDAGANPWDLGAELPGHLDLRIFQRDDFNARAPEASEPVTLADHQQRYVQLDGRVSAPVTLALRLTRKPDIPGFAAQTGNGKPVAATSVAVRHLPGPPAGTGVTDEQPTFRIRAELRTPFARPPTTPSCSEANPRKETCLDVAVVPRYLDVGLDADPAGDPAPPARTIDAVVDQQGARTEAELAAFAGVGDALGERVPIVPQISTRLDPLDVLVAGPIKFGTTFSVLLDGVAEASFDAPPSGLFELPPTPTGDPAGLPGLRLRQNALGMRLDPQGGRARLQVGVEAGIHVRAPFVAVDVSRRPLNLGFFDCGTRRFTSPSDTLTAAGSPALAAFAPELFDFVDGDGIPFVDVEGKYRRALLGQCLAVSDPGLPLIAAGRPAPRYHDPQRPDVPGTPAASGAPPDGAVEGAQPEPVEIAQDTTLCGAIDASRFTVLSGTTVRVGRQDERIEQTVGGTTQTVTCDGHLTITADTIRVDGTIDASGVIDRADGRPQGAGRPGARDPSVGESAPGAGGGVVELFAATVNGAGVVLASGGDGAGGTGSVCERRGGPGGEGGTVSVDALSHRLDVEARGGSGGPGEGVARGGRGGGGGTLRERAVSIERTGDARGGDGGLGGACADGLDGADGAGDKLEFARGDVERFPADAQAIVAEPRDVRLDVTAIREDHRNAVTMLCSRSVAPTAPGGAASPELLPPPLDAGIEDRAEAIVDWFADERHDCREVDLVDEGDPRAGLPTQIRRVRPIGDFEIDRDGTEDDESSPFLRSDGWHSFYAVALIADTVEGDVFAGQCTARVGPCVYPGEPPAAPMTVVGVDTTGPLLTVTPRGSDGCKLLLPQVDARCVTGPTADVDITLDDEFAGADGVRCELRAFPNERRPVECGVGRSTIGLHPPAGEGARFLDVTATDRLGNATRLSSLESPADFEPWLVDATPPELELELTPRGDEQGGFFDQPPTLSARARDRSGAGAFTEVGLAAGSITILRDGERVLTCGEATEFGGFTDCDAQAAVPERGTHRFGAEIVDRVGNTFRLPASLEQEMRVDDLPPRSRLVLDPPAGEAANGIHLAPPVLGFAASDDPDGAGIDLAGGALTFTIDNGPERTFQPGEDALVELLDGVHTVCFAATDRAGNDENERCAGGIRVDATPPEAELLIEPGNPDVGGVHLRPPVVDARAVDGGNQPTGVARVELAIDGGRWRPAERTELPGEGVHVIRARAFDHAGNASDVSERTVRVDGEDPRVRVTAFPPAPNAAGWFRRERLHDAAAADTLAGTGVTTVRAALDGGPLTPLAAPVVFENGVHTLSLRATDRAGRSAEAGAGARVDSVAPSAAIVGPPPPLTLIALLGQRAPLRFTAGDDRSARLRARIVVLSEIDGRVVRTLAPAGAAADGTVAPGPLQASWNGRGEGSALLLPGLFTARLIITDEAGNTASSSETRAILLVA